MMSSTPPPRILILGGTGFIGPVHIEALRRLGIEVVALAGSSRERAAENKGAHEPRV